MKTVLCRNSELPWWDVRYMDWLEGMNQASQRLFDKGVSSRGPRF